MVVTVVNEATRNAEMVDKMLQIQSKLSEKVQLVTPARKLLRDETVALIKDGKRKEKRRYLLFNDLLVITKPAKMSGDKLVLVRIMPLDEIAVTSGTHGPLEQARRCAEVGLSQSLWAAIVPFEPSLQWTRRRLMWRTATSRRWASSRRTSRRG